MRQPSCAAMRQQPHQLLVLVLVAVVSLAVPPGRGASAAAEVLVEVHAVPHSHVDPGWTQTFEAYYAHNVRGMLSNVLVELLLHEDRTFAWESLRFLDTWLDEVGHAPVTALLTAGSGGDSSSARLHSKADLVHAVRNLCDRQACSATCTVAATPREQGQEHQEQRQEEMLCPTVLEALRLLMRKGRFELVGGGWVSHDEQTTPATAVWENIRVGQTWIEDVLGEEFKPDIAWQVDSFGHSAATSLLFAQAGHRMQVWNRVPSEWKTHLKHSGALTFWLQLHENVHPPCGQQQNFAEREREADTAAAAADAPVDCILTTVLPEHYSSPAGIDVDHLSALGQPHLSIGHGAGHKQVEKLASKIVAYVLEHKEFYPAHPQAQMLLFGDDFRFKHPAESMLALQRVFDAVNRRTAQHGVHISMSTPSRFLRHIEMQQHLAYPTVRRPPPRPEQQQLVADASTTAAVGPLPVLRMGDALPYSDNPLNAWTGYLSSRLALRDEILRLWRLLEHMPRPSSAVAGSTGDAEAPEAAEVELRLRQIAMALFHHDAVTGTCSRKVCRVFGEQAIASQNSFLQLLRKTHPQQQVQHGDERQSSAGAQLPPEHHAFLDNDFVRVEDTWHLQTPILARATVAGMSADLTLRVPDPAAHGVRSVYTCFTVDTPVALSGAFKTSSTLRLPAVAKHWGVHAAVSVDTQPGKRVFAPVLSAQYMLDIVGDREDDTAFGVSEDPMNTLAFSTHTVRLCTHIALPHAVTDQPLTLGSGRAGVVLHVSLSRKDVAEFHAQELESGPTDVRLLTYEDLSRTSHGVKIDVPPSDAHHKNGNTKNHHGHGAGHGHGQGHGRGRGQGQGQGHEPRHGHGHETVLLAKSSRLQRHRLRLVGEDGRKQFVQEVRHKMPGQKSVHTQLSFRVHPACRTEGFSSGTYVFSTPINVAVRTIPIWLGGWLTGWVVVAFVFLWFCVLVAARQDRKVRGATERTRPSSPSMDDDGRPAPGPTSSQHARGLRRVGARAGGGETQRSGWQYNSQRSTAASAHLGSHMLREALREAAGAAAPPVGSQAAALVQSPNHQCCRTIMFIAVGILLPCLIGACIGESVAQHGIWWHVLVQPLCSSPATVASTAASGNSMPSEASLGLWNMNRAQHIVFQRSRLIGALQALLFCSIVWRILGSAQSTEASKGKRLSHSRMVWPHVWGTLRISAMLSFLGVLVVVASVCGFVSLHPEAHSLPVRLTSQFTSRQSPGRARGMPHVARQTGFNVPWTDPQHNSTQHVQLRGVVSMVTQSVSVTEIRSHAGAEAWLTTVTLSPPAQDPANDRTESNSGPIADRQVSQIMLRTEAKASTAHSVVLHCATDLHRGIESVPSSVWRPMDKVPENRRQLHAALLNPLRLAQLSSRSAAANFGVAGLTAGRRLAHLLAAAANMIVSHTSLTSSSDTHTAQLYHAGVNAIQDVLLSEPAPRTATAPALGAFWRTVHYDYKVPIPFNYVLVQSAAHLVSFREAHVGIRDTDRFTPVGRYTGVTFSPSVSVGGAVYKSSAEFMLHRQSLVDDDKGLHQALRDEVRTRIWIGLATWSQFAPRGPLDPSSSRKHKDLFPHADAPAVVPAIVQQRT